MSGGKVQTCCQAMKKSFVAPAAWLGGRDADKSTDDFLRESKTFGSPEDTRQEQKPFECLSHHVTSTARQQTLRNEILCFT